VLLNQEETAATPSAIPLITFYDLSECRFDGLKYQEKGLKMESWKPLATVVASYVGSLKTWWQAAWKMRLSADIRPNFSNATAEWGWLNADNQQAVNLSEMVTVNTFLSSPSNNCYWHLWLAE
jgi:hypothetical protein